MRRSIFARSFKESVLGIYLLLRALCFLCLVQDFAALRFSLSRAGLNAGKTALDCATRRRYQRGSCATRQDQAGNDDPGHARAGVSKARKGRFANPRAKA
jgi:hypothetical protein